MRPADGSSASSGIQRTRRITMSNSNDSSTNSSEQLGIELDSCRTARPRLMSLKGSRYFVSHRWWVVVTTIAVLLSAAAVDLTTILRTCAVVTVQYVAGQVVLRRVDQRRPADTIAVPFLIGLIISVCVRQTGLALNVGDLGPLVLLAIMIAGSSRPMTDSSRFAVGGPRTDQLLLVSSIALIHDTYWTIGLAAAALAVQVLRTRRRSILGPAGGIVIIGTAAGFSRIFISHDQWLAHRADYLFFDGLARMTDRYGIWDNPYAAGTPLSYHSLTFGWLGQLERLAHADRWTAIAVIGPVVLGVILMTEIWTLLTKLGSRRPLMAAVAIAAMSSVPVWSVGLHVLRLESLSTIAAGIGLLGLVSLTVIEWGQTRRHALVVSLLVFATTSMKISHGVLAVLICISPLLRRRTRSSWYRAVAGPVGFVVGVALLMPPWVSTSDRSMRIDPLSFGWQLRGDLVGAPAPTYVLASAMILLTLAGPAVAVILLPRSPLPSEHGLRFAIGGGLAFFAGLASCCMGQGYFLQASVLLATPVAAAALTRPGIISEKLILVLASLAAISSTTIHASVPHFETWIGTFRGKMIPYLLAVPILGSCVLWPLHRSKRTGLSIGVIALVVGWGIGAASWSIVTSRDLRETFDGSALTPIEAASTSERTLTRWLGQWTPPETVLGSNYGLCDESNCMAIATDSSAELGCRGDRSFGTSGCWFGSGLPLVSLVDRRFFVTHHSWLSRGATPESIAKRIAETLIFTMRPGAASVAPLREAGIRWFIVDKDLPHADDYGSVGTVRYENERFIVLELFDA